jgi:hypothetical protein
MKVYTFSEARQQLAGLLNQARRDGEVRIKRRDGQEFVVQPAPTATGSPLDVPGLELDIPVEEIVGAVRESRRSTERFLKPAPKRRATEPTGRARPADRRRR